MKLWYVILCFLWFPLKCEFNFQFIKKHWLFSNHSLKSVQSSLATPSSFIMPLTVTSSRISYLLRIFFRALPSTFLQFLWLTFSIFHLLSWSLILHSSYSFFLFLHHHLLLHYYFRLAKSDNLHCFNQDACKLSWLLTYQ